MTRIDEVTKWVESRNVKTGVIDKTRPLTPIKKDAARVADFANSYWSEAKDRPGLENAGLGLSRDVVSNIEYEISALNYIRDQYIDQLTLDADKRKQLDRAHDLLFDFLTFLNWYIVASDNDQWDDSIEKVEADHPDVDMDSLDDLCHALCDYASLSKEILQREKVPGISLEMVDEAMKVASKLSNLDSDPIPVSGDAKALLTLKFELVAMLQKDVEKIRKAAHFVFRHHPEILEKVASTYLSTIRVAEYRAERINKTAFRNDAQNDPMRILPKN